MIEDSSMMPKLTASELVRTRWIFGPRNHAPLTDTFGFGESGTVENYQNDNEVRWSLNGDTLEIYQRGGRLMWTSERVVRSADGRRYITLKTDIDPDVEFVLSEYKPPACTAEYLFPQDLRVTTTKLERVLIVGSCMSAWFHHELSTRFPQVTFDYILFNGAEDVPATLPAAVTDYDFQYLQIPIREVLTDRAIWAHRFNEPQFGETILADGCNVIDVMLSAGLAHNVKHGLLTFVCNFFVPQMSAAPSLRSRCGPADLTQIIRKLNDYLADAVHRYENAYLVDMNAIGDCLGKRYILDDMIYFYSHGSIAHDRDVDFALDARIEPIPPIADFYESRAEDFIQAVYEQMIWTYRTVRQIDPVKAVVFDLDNTLWRGQIAEHYRPEDADAWPVADGWPMGLWEAVHCLRARGILVAVCSRNDLDTVARHWDNAVRPQFISLNDFSSVKINWRPKAENIQAICAEFNIKPKSVLFVDDNPVERAAVAAALPAIRVIGSNPYLTRRILLWAAETQVATCSDESIRREDMIRRQIVREETRSAMTREQFLATLGCTASFTQMTDVNSADFGRAIELINKTNQFNTTAQRWSHAEIRQFLAAGGRLLAFSVTDRFADYGLVGVLLIQGADISQFVMSCRVLGMQVERAAIARAVALIRRGSAIAVTASVQHTADNRPCREVYAKCGFLVAEQSEERQHFVLERDALVAVPPHIVSIEGSRRDRDSLRVSADA